MGAIKSVFIEEEGSNSTCSVSESHTWSEVKEVIKIFWFGHTKALIKNIARGTTDPEIESIT